MARLTRLFVAVSLAAFVLTAPHLADAAGADIYIVEEGDTLSAIAARHAVTLTSLVATNGLTVDSVIHPGMQLTLPNAASGSFAPSSGSTYTVNAGDTLSAIATRHDVSLPSLLATNGLTVDSVIHPGMQLTLPSTASGSSAAAPSSGSTYTVRAGDTLSGIATRHNVGLTSLVATNGLTVNSVIHPGMQLTLPTGADAPSTTTGSSATQSRIDVVVNFAVAQVGKPYRFWSAGPNTFDCSGLTLAAYAQVGVELVHHSATQARQGTSIDFWSEPIRPGDLVFMATNGSEVINHVGIAVNSTTWVQARQSRGEVRIGSLPSDSMIIAVRRLIPAD